MRLFLFGAATVLAGAALAADQGLLNLAMPDAQFMVGINVDQVKLSPLGQFLLAQSAQQPNDAGLQMLIDTTGFDLRRDVREVLLAAAGQPGDSSTIILIRGTFDVPRIIEAALSKDGSVETYNGIPVIQPNSQQRQSVAFPDNTLAIAGNTAAVHAAVDRKTKPAPIGSALAAEVNQLSGAEDAWLVSTAPLARLPEQAPYAALNKMQHVSGGIKCGTSLAVSLQAMFPTAQDSSATAELLKSLLSVGDLYSHDSYFPAAALLKNVSVSADGQVTRISLSVPEQQIEQLLKNSQPHAAAPLLP